MNMVVSGERTSRGKTMGKKGSPKETNDEDALKRSSPDHSRWIWCFQHSWEGHTRQLEASTSIKFTCTTCTSQGSALQLWEKKFQPENTEVPCIDRREKQMPFL